MPANKHRMFHFVLNVYLKSEPAFQGKGNWTKAQNWDRISQSRAGRRLLYKDILLSSRLIDRVCGLKNPRSLVCFVKKNRKKFLGD